MELITWQSRGNHRAITWQSRGNSMAIPWQSHERRTHLKAWPCVHTHTHTHSRTHAHVRMHRWPVFLERRTAGSTWTSWRCSTRTSAADAHSKGGGASVDLPDSTRLTCLLAYLLTCLLTYLPSYQLAYLLTYLLTRRVVVCCVDLPDSYLPIPTLL